MYIELGKLRHLLTEVNPQPTHEGDCELCPNRHRNLYEVGGTYACKECRTAIIARVKNEENPLTGAGGRPDSQYKQANGGPFTRGGRIVSPPLDRPLLPQQPSDPFKGFDPLGTVLDPFGSIGAGNPLSTATMRRLTLEAHEAWVKEQQQQRRKPSKSRSSRTEAPVSGESSTSPVGASSASAGGSRTRGALLGSFLGYLSSKPPMLDLLSGSGTPTGQPPQQSSMRTGGTTTTKPVSHCAQDQRQAAEAWEKHKATTEATWPFPEEDSQPIIGQLPLDIEPER